MSTAASLLVAELVLRMVPGVYEPSWPVVTRHDPMLGWSLIPDTSVTLRSKEFEASEQVNSLGLRGPELPEQEEQGAVRVVLLGDSFVEGYTVDQRQTVGAVLEQAIDDPVVRVISAGTRGWSTDQEALFFTENAEVLAPDLTVLLFYMNDVCMNASDRYWRGKKPRYVLRDDEIALEGVPVPRPDFARTRDAGLNLRRILGDVVRGSALSQLSSRAIDRMRRRVTRPGLPERRAPWSRSLEAYPCLEEGWEMTDRLITMLRDEVESSGSRFVVFWVPTKEAVYREAWERVQAAYSLDPERFSATEDARRLEEICQRHDLECVIPLDEFRQAALGSDTRLYFEEDPHWTATGHALAARILATVVREQLSSGLEQP